MTKLKCPFCGQELVRHWGMEEPALYCCDNPKCSRGGVATESAWQALIGTKKKLDICIDALKDMSEIIKNYEYGNGVYYALDSHDTMLIAEDVEKTICLIKDNDKDVK